MPKTRNHKRTARILSPEWMKSLARKPKAEMELAIVGVGQFRVGKTVYRQREGHLVSYNKRAGMPYAACSCGESYTAFEDKKVHEWAFKHSTEVVK